MGTSLSLRARQAQIFKFSQAADLLRLSSQELEEHLSMLAHDNPMLVLNQREKAGQGAADMIETLTVQDEPSLYHHALQALSGLIDQGGMLERLVLAFIEELEPSGWLGTSIEDIAEQQSIDTKLVEAALKLVQKRIEPAGLFARNLAECLRLQLEDAGALTDEAAAVLDNLEALENGGVGALVERTGLDRQVVDASLKKLRALDPKPGGRFRSDPLLMREPDVVVSKGPAGLEIIFSNPNLAEFDFWKMPPGQGNSDLAEARDNARSVQQALRLRQLAIRQVVELLVEKQEAYFDDGPAALRPLTMSEIAELSGFHTSTVSRVLHGLLIEGPHGIVMGKTLCPGAVSQNVAHSRPDIQDRIKRMISTEDSDTPLSDKDLTEALCGQGIKVSRRVIAKYRQELGYPPATRRRHIN